MGCTLAPSGTDPRGLKGFVLPPVISGAASGMRLVSVSEHGLEHNWQTFDELDAAAASNADAAACASP